MDAPARAVSGLTPPAKALFVAAAAHAMPRGAVLYVVPSDRGSRARPSPTSASSSARSKGCREAAAERAVLPFPSHEVDPYRGHGAAPRRHLGARARAARLAAGTARVVVASAAALLPRVSAPGAPAATRRSSCRPGQDIAPTDLGELLVDAGFTREDPADEHGEFASAAASSTSFPPARPQPVRLEFIGDTIESLRTLRPGDAALDRRRSIRSTVVPLRDVARRRRSAARPRLRLPRARARASRVIVSEPDEVRRSVEQARRAGASELRGGDRAGADGAVAAAGRALRDRADDGRRALARSATELAAARRSTTASRRARPVDAGRGAVARPLPADRGVPRPGRRLGRRDPAAARARRDDRCSSPPRRAAPSARSSC